MVNRTTKPRPEREDDVAPGEGTEQIVEPGRALAVLQGGTDLGQAGDGVDVVGRPDQVGYIERGQRRELRARRLLAADDAVDQSG